MFSNELGLGFVRLGAGAGTGELHAVYVAKDGQTYTRSAQLAAQQARGFSCASLSSSSSSTSAQRHEAFAQLQEFVVGRQQHHHHHTTPVASTTSSYHWERDFAELNEDAALLSRLVRMSSELDRIDVRVGGGDGVIASIHLPTRQVDCSAWLPTALKQPVFSAQHAPLRVIVHQLDLAVESLRALWHELDAIDAQCRVLDPAMPCPRAVTRRRLALFTGSGKEQHRLLFVELALSPQQPRLAPSMQVLGVPDKDRAKWNAALDAYAWDKTVSVVENLTAALATLGGVIGAQQQVAAIEEAASSQQAEECGICYVYRLEAEEDEDGEGEAELPDCGCETCHRPFHRSCALAYLRALPTARRSFRLLLGECPYCNEMMTVRE